MGLWSLDMQLGHVPVGLQLWALACGLAKCPWGCGHGHRHAAWLSACGAAMGLGTALSWACGAAASALKAQAWARHENGVQL